MTIETQVFPIRISQAIYRELYETITVAHMTLEQIDPKNPELKLIKFNTNHEAPSCISFTNAFEERYLGQGLTTALYSYKNRLEQEVQVCFKPSETL